MTMSAPTPKKEVARGGVTGQDGPKEVVIGTGAAVEEISPPAAAPALPLAVTPPTEPAAADDDTDGDENGDGVMDDAQIQSMLKAAAAAEFAERPLTRIEQRLMAQLYGDQLVPLKNTLEDRYRAQQDPQDLERLRILRMLIVLLLLARDTWLARASS
jgi:hypothetical protein